MRAKKAKPREELEASVLDAGRRVGQAAVLYHAKVGEHFGLGATDMKALDLVQSTGPLTPADLAVAMGFAPASVTAMLDRLESRGLLRRVPHPTDGRRLLVEFDPNAMQMLVPVYTPFFSSLNDMLADYSDQDLEVIARAFADVAHRQMEAANLLAPPERPRRRAPR